MFWWYKLIYSSGQTLTIEAIGTLKKDIEEGAKVLLQVKYGLIRLVNTEADLCKQVSNVDLECPIKAGPIKLTKDIELPKEIPPVCSLRMRLYYLRHFTAANLLARENTLSLLMHLHSIRSLSHAWRQPLLSVAARW